MSNVIYMYPGQGSQSVGMTTDLIENISFAADYFKEASDLLGRDILAICQEGPADTLKLTENAQIGIFLVSAVLSDYLKQLGMFSPSAVMGHSLGEISAYYASGAIELAQGIQLIKDRGQAMGDACAAVESGMVAVLGLSVTDIEGVIAATSGVVVANLNCPGQIVISGSTAGLESVMDPLKEAGAKRLVPLPVAGAFHSPYMKSASDKFKQAVETQSFQPAKFPVVLNRLAKSETDASKLKENLPIQVISPVRWIESVESVALPARFIEIGPGKVLSGLVKKINRDLDIQSIQSVADVNAVFKEAIA